MVEKMQAITFNDSQNRQQKIKKIPVGTKITVTDTVYEVKEDGVYKDGEKLKDNTVNVILPQLSAVSLFDVDKDGDIDREDIKVINKKEEDRRASIMGGSAGEAWLEEKLSNALRRSKSIYDVEMNGGGAFSTGVDDNCFKAAFVKLPKQPTEGTTVKSIFIELPKK